MTTSKTKILMTGGHHTSALPVIDLLAKTENVALVWAGHKHSASEDKNTTLEYQEITSLGIPFHNLIAGKFYKTYNIFRLFKIPIGFLHAIKIILKERPNVILSFGGYLAVPIVIIGWIFRIPSYTHEQTVVAGYANKLVSKFAKKIFISWEQSSNYFPEEKVIYSGLPLRAELFEGTKNLSVSETLPTIYVTAGKTGSHKINLLVEETLEDLLKIANVIHQTGDHSRFTDYERINKLYSQIKDSVDGKYISRKFVLKEEIGSFYKEADMVVARSGAHTTFELMALEKPSLLIPIPWVSHNEQYENAKVVEDSGLAKLLEEKDLNPEIFIETVKHMLKNIDKYKISEEARVDRLDSAKIIVDEILRETKS